MTLPSSSAESTPFADDDTLIQKANENIKQERLLTAARLLRRIQDETKLTDAHRKLLAVAGEIEASTADLRHDPDDSWTQQSSTPASTDNQNSDDKPTTTSRRGRRDTTIYYKISNDGAARLESRIDCVVEESLLVPLLSVLNETDLYSSWIPSWTVPVRMGVAESIQLQNISRGQQIVHIVCNVPWPLSTRDVVIRATAVDDIADNQAIVVRMKSLQTPEDDPVVPNVDSSMVRIDFEGGILFRQCPPEKLPPGQEQDGEQQEGSVLVSFKMFMDPKLSSLPSTLINFVTRTAIPLVWSMLLSVAEGVRDGSRPDHQAAIDKRPELYQWIEERIQVLLAAKEQRQQHEKQEQLNDSSQQQPETTKTASNGGGDQEFIAYLQS